MSITLSPRQKQAVEHVHGPMLVVAGAGTGKTTVLVQRIARLIRDGHAAPHEILALTYTENAAAEMAGRVGAEFKGQPCAGLHATTFHSYCNELIRRAGIAFGVLLKEDLWIYLRKRIRELPLRYFAPARDPGEFLDALLEFFERCQDELVDAPAFAAWAAKLKPEGALPRVAKTARLATMPAEEQVGRWGEIARVYTAVEEMLARDNLGTFGHMITHAARLLRGNAAALEQARQRARFLLIDEFQDVNVGQIEIAQRLAGEARNIFAVGDPDQAIYRFRGATAAAFEEFVHRFPDAQSVVLSDNQRSRTPVLQCAFSVISNNSPVHCRLERSGKRFEREPLLSMREKDDASLPPAAPAGIAESGSDEEEAADVAQAIQDLRAGYDAGPLFAGVRPRIAVLYRSHHNREALLEELARRGIPASVVGVDALETGEARDLIACLRVMDGPTDSGSLFRVAALPVLSVDAERLRELMAAARRGYDFPSLLAQAPGGGAVLDAVAEAQDAARERGMDPAQCVLYARRRFGFDQRSPAVEALCGFASAWRLKPGLGEGNLAEFIEYLDLLPEAGGAVLVENDPGEGCDAVRLMTCHAAKGLEFEHVFILRLAQNSFPVNYRERIFEFPPELRQGKVPLGDSKEVQREEERRLFYVAMTRARDTLTLCARVRQGKRPSGFVCELQKDRKATPYWRQRPARGFEIAAGGEPAQFTGVGRWLMLPSPASHGLDTLSATSIQAYETCPLQYKIGRDWKLPGEIGAGLQYGTAMHAVLRDYFESLRAGRPKDAAVVVACLRAALAELPFEDAYQRELYLRDGAEQLCEFVRLHQAAPPVKVIGTERTFEFQVASVRVRGRVDRIDEISGSRVAIVDYKTGKPRSEIDARKSLQLSLYALAARDLWGLVPEQLVFYNLADNSAVSSTRSDAQLGETADRVQAVAAAIGRGEFDANPGYHCRSCAYEQFCPHTEQRLYTLQEAAAGARS